MKPNSKQRDANPDFEFLDRTSRRVGFLYEDPWRVFRIQSDLIQTDKLANFPVILFGSGYWQPLVDWMRDSMLAEGCIALQDLERIALTDSVETAVRWLENARQGCCHLDGGLAKSMDLPRPPHQTSEAN